MSGGEIAVSLGCCMMWMCFQKSLMIKRRGRCFLGGSAGSGGQVMLLVLVNGKAWSFGTCLSGWSRPRYPSQLMRTSESYIIRFHLSHVPRSFLHVCQC